MAKSETKEILEIVNFIKDYMATSEEMSEVNTRLSSIERELASINRRLDALKEQFGNLKGVTKEIDDLRGRIRVIEQHLKIKRKEVA